MTAQSDRIKALISNIDEALSFSNPRPPLVVMGDSIIQSRQVLEQVRSYLLSLESDPTPPSPENLLDSQREELQSWKQSLRHEIREELNELHNQLTQTIQAEIQALRQERRVLIRELRLLKQHRQQTETVSQPPSEGVRSPQSPPPSPTVLMPLTPGEPFASGKQAGEELFPYAGVELPPPSLQSPLMSVSVAPESEPIPAVSNATVSEQVNQDQSLDQIDRESVSSPPEQTSDESVTLVESIVSNENSEISFPVEPGEPVVNQDPTPSENPPEIPSDPLNDPPNVWGVLDVSETIPVASPALSLASVAATQPTTPPDPIQHFLDQEGYIQASPQENLLPHDDEVEDDNEDQLDTHLRVGKSIKELLEEDLLNLEQQSFIGEDHTTPDFSNPVPQVQEIETFEDFWSETSSVDVNPFAEVTVSEMKLDELISELDENPEENPDFDEYFNPDDLNFEALSRKLQP